MEDLFYRKDTGKLEQFSTEIDLDIYQAYDLIPVMVWISRQEDAQCVFLNKKWYEYTGQKPQMSLTEGWLNCLHPEDITRFHATYKDAWEAGTSFEFECRIRDKSGNYIWHKNSGQPHFDSPGRLIGYIGSLVDIHNQAIETQLKNERELLQKIFDTIPVMLVIWDPTLNVTHLNHAIENITGWTREDCSRKSIMELAYPDVEYRKWVSEYMESLSPGFKDIKMATKDGGCKETSWANIRISDGRNVGIGIDISERKAFEKKLSRLSKQMHTVVENITDGVVVFHPDGEIVSKNKVAKSILSYLLDDSHFSNDPDSFLLYDNRGNLVDKENWPRYRVLRGEFFDKQEYRIYNKTTHKEAYIEYSGIPIVEDDKLKLAIVTFKDVSERKKSHLDLVESNNKLINKNEQLERINQLHENLLYIIAHDLRNPIGNMYLMINMLKDERNDEERANLLELLKEMVKRQENIVLGLVELLQVQSAEKISPSEIFLDDVMEDILVENDAVLADCGAEVNVGFSAAPALRHIPSFVESIMRNLVNNSIKYRKMDEKLVLNITSMNKGEYILVVVEDNGIGIDLVKHNNHLFQPFKRYTRQSEGTGMGLYLIRNLIEKNGGCIDLESTVGVGTKVMCYFREY